MNLIEKVKKHERMSFEEVVDLYNLDLFSLGELADERRQALSSRVK
jgi:aminodeoxyfutalosine synthase